MECRICGNEELESFLSLGMSPLANNLPSQEDLAEEQPVFPLSVAFCDTCKLAQLTHVVPPELMFKNYLYVTSTTQTFRTHFTQMAEELTKQFKLGKHSFAVDIGSNDGLLLKGFQKHGVTTVGVEPADNLAALANKDGVETINAFFDHKVAEQIINKYGKADIVTANNVFAHIHDIKSVVKNVKTLLKDTGVYVTESAYFFAMYDQLTFDAVYHEHLSYYTLTPLVYFFKQQGMEVFKVEQVNTHGGSIRVYAQKQGGPNKIDASVPQLLAEEKKKGVERFTTYQQFGERVLTAQQKLLAFFAKAKKEGKTVVGYGVPAKATTLLTFCKATKDTFSYLVDDNPLKQGRFMPVSHIPIFSSKMLDQQKPDYIMILAWNFAPEIMQKLAKYKEQGVQFVIPLPEPKVL